MQPRVPINLLVEGLPDEEVAKKLLDHLQLPCGRVFGRQGKSYILKTLPNYNNAAMHFPWLVITDLDNDACAPDFIRPILTRPAPHMRFRIAVREIEAWLLADAEAIAGFLGLRVQRIPLDVERLPDPKLSLINLARRSNRKTLRHDMVPREGSHVPVGPGYVTHINNFVRNYWRPDVAAERSDSLRRCLAALQRWAERE
jgi:hypothetical protein